MTENEVVDSQGKTPKQIDFAEKLASGSIMGIILVIVLLILSK